MYEDPAEKFWHVAGNRNSHPKMCPPSCFPSSQNSSIFHWHNLIMRCAWQINYHITQCASLWAETLILPYLTWLDVTRSIHGHVQFLWVAGFLTFLFFLMQYLLNGIDFILSCSRSRSALALALVSVSSRSPRCCRHSFLLEDFFFTSRKKNISPMNGRVFFLWRCSSLSKLIHLLLPI